MDTDDLEPPRPVLKPVDFSLMGVAELRAHIAALQAEIARAEAEIARKDAHRLGAESLFKGGAS